MDCSLFSFEITYSDETGIWQNLWSSIKDQLNLYYASIKLKENFTTITTLSNLNIKMETQSENSKFHLYLIKLNSVTDLKNGVKERIIANLNLRKSYLIVVMDVENSENGMKNALKNLEKIKNELKIQDIKLLPVNTNSNKLIEITNDFFNFLKNLVSLEFNSVMISHLKYNEEARHTKNENKENTYAYLENKIHYISYLQSAEFWREVQTCLEEDMFFTFDCLNDYQGENENSFKEPFSFIESYEFSITKKLNERNLSNFEYQQFIFYNLIRCSKLLRDFKKLNDYFILILSNIYSLKQYFKTKYHFIFWSYLFTSRMITFTKSMKSNFYSNFDEEMNIRTRLIIYYYMKKFIKNYAVQTKCEIPNSKIFRKILEKNIKSDIELNKEISNIIESYDNSELILREADLKYLNFLIEMEENMDEKSRLFLNSKIKLLEEYLYVFDNIEKIHSQLNQNRLMIKIQIEKLPLLILFKKYSAVKIILVNTYNIFKKEKWDFINEYLNFSLLIIINCLEKNEENDKVILNFLNLKLQNIKEENDYYRTNNIESQNEEISNDIISSYLKNCNYTSKIDDLWIQLGKILKAEFLYVNSKEIFGEKSEKYIHIDLDNTNLIKILVKIKNATKLKFFFSKLIFIFEDEMGRGDVFFEYFSEEFKELGEKAEITHEINIDISNENKFKVNSVYLLSAIKFIFASGLEGIYKFENCEQNSKMILKRNELETRSILSHSSICTKIDIKEIHQIYFNTVYSLFLEFRNFDKFNFSNKIINIFIRNLKEDLELDQSKFQLIENKFEVIECSNSPKEELFNQIKKKITIKSNKIELGNDLGFQDDLIILKFFFIITDINYAKCLPSKIEITTQINEKDESLNLEKEDKNLSNLPYIFRETHSISVEHIFSLNHNFRIEKERVILIQTSVNISSSHNFNSAKIFLFDAYEVEIEPMKPINLIRKIKSLNMNDFNINESLNFEYFSSGVKFTYFYPEKDLKEKIIDKINYPKYISISIQSDQQEETAADGIRLFSEYSLNVKITKFSRDDALISIKVKENENWAIVGKSKIIERFYIGDDDKDLVEKNIVFRIIPLQDGYVKLPFLELMKFDTFSSASQDFDNVNTLEFVPLDPASLIDGNEKIVKVYSINSCALRLNII